MHDSKHLVEFQHTLRYSYLKLIRQRKETEVNWRYKKNQNCFVRVGKDIDKKRNNYFNGPIVS